MQSKIVRFNRAVISFTSVTSTGGFFRDQVFLILKVPNYTLK